MNPILTVLALGSLVGLIQLQLTAAMVTKARGTKWNLSSRDEPMPPLTGHTARMQRAFENFKETYPFFIAAVVIALGTGHVGHASVVAGYVFVVARAIYVPLYVFNVIVIRTLVWILSGFAILGIALAAL